MEFQKLEDISNAIHLCCSRVSEVLDEKASDELED